MVVPALLALAVMSGVVGCVNSQGINEAHEARVKDIRERYSAVIARSDRGWKKIIAKVEAKRRDLVAIESESTYLPVHPVWGESLSHQYEECSASPPQQQSECMAAIRDRYARALDVRYSYADFAWALAVFKSGEGKITLEQPLAYSHNARLTQWLESGLAEIAKHRAKFRAQMAKLQVAEEGQSAQRRDIEIAEAEERRRRAWGAVAAGLQAAGSAMSQAAQTGYASPGQVATSTYAPSPPTAGIPSAAVPQPSGCASDFNCPFGHRCVKPNFATAGTCMQEVNQYGTPTFKGPETDSVMPKMPSPSDCHFDTECPIGFRCDNSSGTCVK